MMPLPGLRALWRRYRAGGAAAAGQRPLLEPAALAELARYARAMPVSLLEFDRQTAHPLLGERPSPQRGRGYEFEENRLYQPGDEQRLLNWRLYARSGELYSKVFTEERRPQVCLLVDRRAPMRFATRRQLKATLAASLAACYAFQAQRQALAVGGLVLGERLEWLEPAAGESGVQALLQAISAPCPPLPFAAAAPAFTDALGQLDQRLPAGAFILLLSDFADLDPQALPRLYRLAQRHSVQAIQVLDPAEQALPGGGPFLIEDVAGAAPLPVSGTDPVQQAGYREAFAVQQAQRRACLAQAGIGLRSCSTTQDVAGCLGTGDVGLKPCGTSDVDDRPH